MTRPRDSAMSSNGSRELVAQSLLDLGERFTLEANDAPAAFDEFARRSRVASVPSALRPRVDVPIPGQVPLAARLEKILDELADGAVSAGRVSS